MCDFWGHLFQQQALCSQEAPRALAAPLRASRNSTVYKGENAFGPISMWNLQTGSFDSLEQARRKLDLVAMSISRGVTV